MNFLRKIARSIDRWLASPHRALLTWAILEVLTVGILFVLFRNGVLYALYHQWSVFLASVLPFPLPASHDTATQMAILGFGLSWYRPVILRLGFWRWIALVATVTGLAMGGMLVLMLPFGSLLVPWMVSGAIFLLPVLLIAGRRGPLIRAVGGASIVWFIWLLVVMAPGLSVPMAVALVLLADVIGAAIVLYGTKPIVRGTASGGEEKARVGEEKARVGEEKASVAPGTASGGEESQSIPRDTPSLGGES